MPTCFNYLAVDRSMSTFQFQVGMPMRWNNPEAFKACLCPKWPGGQLRSPLLGLWIYQAGWPCFSFNGDRPSCFCVRKEDGTTRSVSVDGSERIHRASPSLTEPHNASRNLLLRDNQARWPGDLPWLHGSWITRKEEKHLQTCINYTYVYIVIYNNIYIYNIL